MSIGQRILSLRKALKLTQEEFSSRLKISKGFLSNLEKGVRFPSDQLIKLISYEFSSSENWLETGEGETFVSPEESLKNIMARLGERAFLDAVNNVMKEKGLAFAAGRPAHRLDTGDPELDRMINILQDLWAAGDDRLKGWTSINFDRSFPTDVVEEVQKKQKETHGQAQVG